MAENTSTQTQIREAENQVKVEGYLREMRLEDKDDIISGDVIIATDMHSEHSVSVYANKFNKNGNANRAYKGLQTVMAEYVSIASLLKEGRTLEEAVTMATKVSIGLGKLTRNEFYANDELISRPRISSNFFNRIKDDTFEPKAEFDIECYFERIRSEIKDDTETGRLLVDVIVPMYGGVVVPMELVAEGDAAEYIKTHYDAKRTGRVWGNIVNIAERIVTKVAGFGKAKEDVKLTIPVSLSLSAAAKNSMTKMTLRPSPRTKSRKHGKCAKQKCSPLS
jgi:hypothetical protein